MVQHSCGFRDSSPAEFRMMSCWSFPLQGCHCWDLGGKSIRPLPLKTYIRLCKVVKCSGFFVSLVIRVIPGIVHWMKNSVKLYLRNSGRIWGLLVWWFFFFWEEWSKTLSSFLLESPALRQTVTKSYCPVCFVTRLGQMVFVNGCNVSFHLWNSKKHQSVCGRGPVPGEQCRCHWKVRLPWCSVSAHKKGDMQSLQLLRPLAFSWFLWQIGLLLWLLCSFPFSSVASCRRWAQSWSCPVVANSWSWNKRHRPQRPQIRCGALSLVLPSLI